MISQVLRVTRGICGIQTKSKEDEKVTIFLRVVIVIECLQARAIYRATAR